MAGLLMEMVSLVCIEILKRWCVDWRVISSFIEFGAMLYLGCLEQVIKVPWLLHPPLPPLPP